jgi:hypothetical protein
LISCSFALIRSRRDFRLIWESPRRDLALISTSASRCRSAGLEYQRYRSWWAFPLGRQGIPQLSPSRLRGATSTTSKAKSDLLAKLDRTLA